MTSLERRREARYQRRVSRRLQKKMLRNEKHDNIETIISMDHLFKANHDCKKGVSWKNSTQQRQIGTLRKLASDAHKIANGTYESAGFAEFDLRERGKLRHIRSVRFAERVIQKSVCDNTLMPLLKPTLIYDNGACIPGKGTDHALARMKAMLQKYYRRNNFDNHGYIVNCDLSDYFNSVRHDLVFERYSKNIFNEDVIVLLRTFIEPFGYPFKTERTVRRKPNTGEYTGLSLGLGSQVSQITALYFPSNIDHYIKEQLGVKYYIRYMDDSIAIFHTKEEARAYLDAIDKAYTEMGLKLNRKKTQIRKLESGFTFLKVRHALKPTGYVYRRLSRASITGERRKLTKLHKKYLAGQISLQDIKQSYASWKGYAVTRGGIRAALHMDKYYKFLYGNDVPLIRLRSKKKPTYI